MKSSFMHKLSLGIIVAVVLFAVTLTFVNGLTTAANGIATYFGPEDMNPPFPQPFWELLLAFAMGFIPISIVIWEHEEEKTVAAEALSTPALKEALKELLTEIATEGAPKS